MQDWERLAKLVIARRVALGHRTRIQLSEASGISVRILGDIETGRRGRFDPKTIAALENVLGWATGSVEEITGGGEPIVIQGNTTDGTAPTGTDNGIDAILVEGPGEEAFVRVMQSKLAPAQKREVIKILIAEKQRAERQRAEHAEELIRLLGGGA